VTLAEPPHDEVARPVAPTQPLVHRSPFHSSSILLIEDNLADVRLTVELFREAKLANRLKVIGNGAQALAHLRQHDCGNGEPHPMPDLVLLDLDLPGLDGRSVLAAIRAEPRLRHLPVLVLTASVLHGEHVREEGLAADGYLTKPIDLGAFVRAVCSVDRFWLEVVCAPPG